jgi:hypothetical protein
MTETFSTSSGDVDEFEMFARELEETAQLWRRYGKRARVVAREWMAGAKGVSLEPSRGTIYKACTDPNCIEFQDVRCTDLECPDLPRWGQHTHRVGVTHSHPVANHDPAGEAADGENVDPAGDRLHRMDRARQMIGPLARELRSIVRETCPQSTGLRRVDTASSEEEVVAAGYCVSCWRNGKKLVERATDRQGRAIYAQYCRWCGDFIAAHRDVLGAQGMPPIELVKLRHDGKRISSGRLAKALERVRRERGLT